MYELKIFFSLHKLHGELSAAAAREKETVSALNDAEEVLTKRRSDIARMRDQVTHVDDSHSPDIHYIPWGTTLKLEFQEKKK